MLVRRYRPTDAPALDILLHNNREGDVRLDRDIIVVGGEPAVSTLAWRPCALVHELVLSSGLARRNTAQSLVNFAIADATARPFFVRDALFLVDALNEPMLRFVRSLSGIREDNGRVFHLDLEAT